MSFKVAKINNITQNIQIYNEFSDNLGAMNGIGMPEQMKGDFKNYFSRRINEKEILEENVVEIYSFRGHYEDK